MPASALTALVVSAGLALGGCTLGQPGSFSGRAESDCRATSAEIARLVRPTSTTDRLAYALDRYSSIERLVSEISSDIAFPGGTRGATLRAKWLDPSRRSLRTGLNDLARLRTAVRAGDGAALATSYAAALAAGTQGVDADTLRSEGLPDCAPAFTPTTPTAS